MDLTCYRCRGWPCECADGITLIHGDCRDAMTLISTGGIHAIVTDPPYGINRSNHGGLLESRGPIANDHSTEIGEYILKVCDAFNMPLAIFASPRKPWPGEWRNLIVWDKGGAVAGGGDLKTCLKLSWELIQIARNGEIHGGRDTSVWTHRITQTDFVHHPNEKPVALMARLIATLFGDAECVCDPCAGSGSTLVAAKQLGIRAVGIEIDERYCAIAARRLQQKILEFHRHYQGADDVLS